MYSPRGLETPQSSYNKPYTHYTNINLPPYFGSLKLDQRLRKKGLKSHTKNEHHLMDRNFDSLRTTSPMIGTSKAHLGTLENTLRSLEKYKKGLLGRVRREEEEKK